MKAFLAVALTTVVLPFVCGASSLSAETNDPCQSAKSNAEMRECYYTEQVRINAEADSLASKLAAGLREEARDSSNGPVVNGLLEKAAAEVIQSQQTWRDYRDQHCTAVRDSWTTGSGAGTAYEACLFDLGQQRLRELHSAFDEDQPSKVQQR